MKTDRNKVLRRILDSEDMPSLPPVAIKILQLTQSDNSSMLDLSQAVQQDPGLVAKILKISNSPLFRGTRRVTSIQQAILMLGMNSVRTIALTLALVGPMRKGIGASFDAIAFWRRSIMTGVIAEILSRVAETGRPDEAFTAGLLADIGILAICHSLPEEHLQLKARRDGPWVPDCESERDLLGWTHAEIGAALLEHWGLPESFCDKIRHHHDPVSRAADDPASDDGSIHLLQIAARASSILCGEVAWEEMESVHREMENGLGLEAEQVRSMVEDAGRTVDEMARLLEIDLGPVPTDELAEATIGTLTEGSDRTARSAG